MNFDFKNKKFSLKILITLFVTFLFVLTGIIFAVYFHKSISDIIIKENNERARVLAKSLAASSRYSVLNEDRLALDHIASDVLYEKDVTFIMISDNKGRILIGKNNPNEENVKIPQNITEKVLSGNNPQIIPFAFEGKEFICASNPIRIDSSFQDPFIDVPSGASGFYENKEDKTEESIKKGHVFIVFTLEHAKKSVKEKFNTIIIFILLITSIGILLALIFLKAIIKPIEYMVDVSTRIAAGDITKRVKKTAFVEYDGLSAAINKISGKLMEVLNGVMSTVQEISNSTDSIQKSSNFLFEGAKEQSASVNTISISIAEMNDSIKTSALNIKGVFNTATHTSSSMKKIAESIQNVSENTNSLSDAINNSSSSIIEMTSSIKEIAKNTDELSNIMKNTAGSIKEMDTMISKITDISNEACLLSDKVKTNASELGLKSIEKMSASMDNIRQAVQDSSTTIKRLGATSSQIGEILNVIEGITEQTGLLALNAAILAAQAGKHGKGFAVVADEIKALADRTASSTKEITYIIKGIQHDVDSSIKAVNIGKESVAEGVTQTKEVVKAFEYIYNSADSSLKKTSDIKSYSLAQAGQIEVINKSIEMMANMVYHVVKATSEQKNASEHIMEMTEHISKITGRIKESIKEQSHQSQQVSMAINDITSSINMISTSVSGEAVETGNIVTTTKRIKNITTKNVEYNDELAMVIQKLSELSELLKNELKHFKL